MLSVMVWSPIVQWGGLEFTLFSGVVWSSHCTVGWSGVHIIQLDGLEFTLFTVVVWSSVGLPRVHIVLWGGLEFKLLCERQSGGME